MANLAASAVTISDSWEHIHPGGRRYVSREVVLVLTGQGGGTNDIPASVLKLSSIKSCSPLVEDDDSAMWSAAPDYAGTSLLVSDDAGAPGDATGTFKCIVTGVRAF